MENYYDESNLNNLSLAIKEAVGKAFLELFKNGEHYYYCVMFTTGEALPPYISAWSFEALERYASQNSEEDAQLDKWSLCDSPYYAFGEEYFKDVVELFGKRPVMDYQDDDAWEKEWNFRLYAMETAMKELDEEGIFALNQPRENVCVNVELLTPDVSNTERALRLNKPENIKEWLVEAAEE